MSNIPSIAMIPSAYKSGKVYSVLPSDGSGDLNFTRASEATRVNQNGLIETVGINIPRLDYSDGECPSLLLEPTRTNLITYSEDFSDASWQKINTGTGVAPAVTSNQGISPKGDLTADRVVFNVNSASSDRSIIRQSLSALSTKGKITFYAKSNTGENQYVLYHDGDNEGEATITNEWQRFEFEADGVGRTYIGLELRNGVSTSNTSDILLWGFQVEDVDTYATSYIPTNGSTVTREAETASKANISNYINSSEGVLYFEGSALVDSGDKLITLNLDANNRVSLRLGTNFVLGNLKLSGTNQAEIIQVRDTTNNFKLAFKYKTNDFALWVNGVEVNTQNSGNTFNIGILNSLQFNNGGGGLPFYGRIRDLRVYNTALTDAQLQQLTS